jgi:bifunctional DNA-binding transcriptional regulator/antitoxin component of YhaV-PrlF toxin-antitoxin module
MITTLSSKGQLVLPAPLRQKDKIMAGQRFEIHRVDEGQYLLQREDADASAGLVDWLLACPSKDWFQPFESEATDSL